MIRVLVADAQPIVREALARLVGEQRDMELHASFATGDDLIGVVQASHADVCVMDLAIPGGGLEAIRRIVARRPEVRVIVFTIHPESRYALRAMAAGASGYVLKTAEPDELLYAIRVAATGGRYLRRPAGELMADRLAVGAALPPHEQLSNREFDVFVRLADGLSLVGIAAELGVSVKTISTLRARVLDKLSLSRNAELTRYALEHGLIA
jgi:two-component system invasion response regulator UvrY